MIQSFRYITWSILFVVLATTGCAEISKKAGVENVNSIMHKNTHQQ
jgi:hypothetical protein